MKSLKRSGGGVPVSLLDSATWAVPRFAPFIRMAVAHAVRRGLAEAVLRHWRRVADPADVLAGQGGCRPPCPRSAAAAAAAAAADRCHPSPRWHGRAARRVWSSAAWAVRLGWFRVCVRTGVACVWFRAVCANVCVWYVVSEYAWCLARVSPGVSMKILKTNRRRAERAARGALDPVWVPGTAGTHPK